jgi:hypothetical protein
MHLEVYEHPVKNGEY